MYDEIDRKIVNVLKEEGEANISRLILKSFPRESNTVFRARLERLKIKNIITIDGGSRNRNTGNSYTIKLKNKNRKV